MVTLGSYLSGLRTARSISLEEMARSTRVSQRYLQALEVDDHAELPAPVFTRGFIRAYCQSLDEPVEEALELYAEHLGEKPGSSGRAETVRRPEKDGGARSAVLVSLVLLVVLGVALFALTFVLQGGSHQSPEPKPVAQSKPAPAADPKESPRAEAKTAETGLTPVAVAAVPEPPPTVTPQATAPAVEAPTPRIFTADPAKPETTSSKPEVTPARSELTQAKPGTPAAKPETPVARYETPVVRSEVSRPKPEVAPAKPDSLPTSVTTATVPAAASPYRLVARATEKTWVRVLTDDGRVVAEEVIPAGERREWLSNRKFVVTVGNAGGVALELNGQLLPKLGPTGEVVRRVVIPAEER